MFYSWNILLCLDKKRIFRLTLGHLCKKLKKEKIDIIRFNNYSKCQRNAGSK